MTLKIIHLLSGYVARVLRFDVPDQDRFWVQLAVPSCLICEGNHVLQKLRIFRHHSFVEIILHQIHSRHCRSDTGRYGQGFIYAASQNTTSRKLGRVKASYRVSLLNNATKRLFTRETAEVWVK